jgi:hypothetical protein
MHEANSWFLGDERLRIISKKSNFYEISISRSKFFAAEEALEATLAGRWLLSDYKSNGWIFLLRRRNSKVEHLHVLEEIDPEKVLICGSMCPHETVALKTDLSPGFSSSLPVLLDVLSLVWRVLGMPGVHVAPFGCPVHIRTRHP